MRALMQHPRKMIRQAFVEMITPCVTDAGAQVYDSRAYRPIQDSIPTIVVRARKEKIQAQHRDDFGLRQRILKLTVRCYHSGDQAPAVIDDLVWQIENLVHTNPTLQDTVEACRLTKTKIVTDSTGIDDVHRAIMHFEIVYYTHLIAQDGEPPVEVMLGFTPDVAIVPDDHDNAVAQDRGDAQ